jgi:hypothetical protein
MIFLNPSPRVKYSPVYVRLRIIYHNISVGLYTNQHFSCHCLEWILDLLFGSCIKKCQHSSRFAIRGGTTRKSCEGWMGPILMGTHIAFVSHHVLLYIVVLHGSHVRDGWDQIQREPAVASVSRHVLPYVDIPHCEYARQGSTSFKKERI